MKRFNRWFIASLGAILLVGVIGRTLSIGNGDWDFLFEDMIWFPIEVAITVWVIDELLEIREHEQERRRFVRIAKGPTRALIWSVKRQITQLIIPETEYDPNGPKRKSESEQFELILNNPDDYLTEQFFNRMWTFNSLEGTQRYYNYMGASYVYMQKAHDDLKTYLDRYVLVMNDEIFVLVDRLMHEINNQAQLEFDTHLLWEKKYKFVSVDEAKMNILKLMGTLKELEHKIDQLLTV